MKQIYQFVSISFALIVLNGCAVNDSWSKRDTILEISWQVVNVMDAASTANLENTPSWQPVGDGRMRRLEEHSPLTRAVIGPRPSSEDVYVWMATVGISHWLIARALPPKWRPWYQGASILVSGEAVKGNCDHGLC